MFNEKTLYKIPLDEEFFTLYSVFKSYFWHIFKYKIYFKKYSWKEEKKGLFHDKEINEETYLLMDF